MSMDLTNHSSIVQMLERYAKPTRLNWLVFCDKCEIFLNEVNAFEDNHDLHGYFTYSYQWIFVPTSRTLETIEANLGRIMNVVVVTPDLTMFTGMFGSKRYLQEITCEGCDSKSFHLQKKQLFPNTINGFNNITLILTLVPWAPYTIKEPSGTYSGYYVHLMEMMAEKLNFTLRIIEPNDGHYGTLNNGQWTGMIGQLTKKQADIATGLTISHERSLYVTAMRVAVRHMHEVIIYHKPEPIAVSVEILVRPFSTEVWLIFISVLVGTMITFHFSQISKFQMTQNHSLQPHKMKNTELFSQRHAHQTLNIDSLWTEKQKHEHEPTSNKDGPFHQSQTDHKIQPEIKSQRETPNPEISSYTDQLQNRMNLHEDNEIKIDNTGRRGDYGAYILRSTLNQGAMWNPFRTSSRIIYSVYTIGWIVIMAIYTGSLVSLLSVKKEVIPFRTFAELGESNEFKLGVGGGTVFYDVLYRNNFTKGDPMYHLKEKVTRDTQRDPSVITSDYDFHEARLITERYALLTVTDGFNSLAARSCRVAMLKEKGERVTDGFMLQKSSAYADDFDHVLSKIQEGDLDKDLKKEFLPKPKQCLTNLNNVSLENIHGFLYILFGGLSVALIALVVENIVSSHFCKMVLENIKHVFE